MRQNNNPIADAVFGGLFVALAYMGAVGTIWEAYYPGATMHEVPVWLEAAVLLGVGVVVLVVGGVGLFAFGRGVAAILGGERA